MNEAALITAVKALETQNNTKAAFISEMRTLIRKHTARLDADINAERREKIMITAPENKAFQTTHPPATADLAELRRQEKALQLEIETTWQEILGLEERAKRLVGGGFGADWRATRQELATAEHKLSRLTSALDDHRLNIVRTEREAAEEQKRRAAQEAAILEPEIIAELLSLAEHMAALALHSRKIEGLRHRARQLGEQHLTRAVREAIYFNSGEVSPENVEQRLAMIEKCSVPSEKIEALKVQVVMAVKEGKRQRQQEENRCAAAVRSLDNPKIQGYVYR